MTTALLHFFKVKQTDHAKAQKPWYRRWVFWLEAFIVLPALIVTIHALGTLIAFHWKLASLNDRGIPCTREELREQYRLPLGMTDGTEQWVKALQAVSLNRNAPLVKPLPYVGSGELPKWDQPWEHIQLATIVVDKNTAALESIRLLLKPNRAIRWSANDVPQADESSLVQQLQQIARLLCLENEIAWQNRDRERIHQNLLHLLKLAAMLQESPDFDAIFLKSGLHHIATDQILRFVSRLRLADDRLEELQIQLAQVDFRKELRLAFLTSSAESLEMIRSAYILYFGHAPAYGILQQLEENLLAIEQPAWNQCLDDFERLTNQRNHPNWYEQTAQLQVRLFGGLQTAFPRSAAAQVARQRMLIILLAVERQEAITGQPVPNIGKLDAKFFPKDLHESWQQDPFDGRPLRYHVQNECAQIYSVGWNRKDDGGIRIGPGVNWDQSDLVMSFNSILD